MPVNGGLKIPVNGGLKMPFNGGLITWPRRAARPSMPPPDAAPAPRQTLDAPSTLRCPLTVDQDAC